MSGSELWRGQTALYSKKQDAQKHRIQSELGTSEEKGKSDRRSGVIDRESADRWHNKLSVIVCRKHRQQSGDLEVLANWADTMKTRTEVKVRNSHPKGGYCPVDGSPFLRSGRKQIDPTCFRPERLEAERKGALSG